MAGKPWLNRYDHDVPHSLEPYPDLTLIDVVAENAHRRPNHPALLFKGSQLTYAELDKLSNGFASSLVALGVEKGDRVAILLPNCPQFLVAQFGAWKAGAIVAPLNPLYTERELEHALRDCGAKIGVVLTSFYEKVSSLRSRVGLQIIIATNIKEFLPKITRLLFTLFIEKKQGHRVSIDSGDLWLRDLLEERAELSVPELPIRPDDPALLLFTGGTTGSPKAAVGSHHAIFITGMQVRAWFASVLKDWDDVIMLAVPLFHVYGNIGVMSTGLIGGNPLALVPNPRDLDDLIGTIAKVRPAFLPGVPTLFIGLLNHPKVKAGKVDFKSMKLCISAAAPLLAETKRSFEDLTGGHMLEVYGLTESMLASVFVPVQGEYKEGSVGMPAPDVDVLIVDLDTGEKTLPLGDIGEILIRGKQLMKGYWQNPEETADAIRDGWLFTGDIGYLDDDGYLFIVDRKKDVIKPSGFQVWPREVEEVIATHPAVAEVGVAGVPDAYQGEAAKAWIVLKEGHQATAGELCEYCRERLAAYKVPKSIEFRDTLPKSMVGKVLRRELTGSR
ncbi:MAG: long-chain fatty acid--CoA ligase [Syntrophobacterales bacterium]|jgi:long-chain acyl-CoA synthetase